MYVYNCNSNQIKFSVVEFARCPDKMALERGEKLPRWPSEVEAVWLSNRLWRIIIFAEIDKLKLYHPFSFIPFF